MYARSFFKGTNNARIATIISRSRSSSPGGYTISKNLIMRPLILPTPVIIGSSTGRNTHLCWSIIECGVSCGACISRTKQISGQCAHALRYYRRGKTPEGIPRGFNLQQENKNSKKSSQLFPRRHRMCHRSPAMLHVHPMRNRHNGERQARRLAPWSHARPQLICTGMARGHDRQWTRSDRLQSRVLKSSTRRLVRISQDHAESPEGHEVCGFSTLWSWLCHSQHGGGWQHLLTSIHALKAKVTEVLHCLDPTPQTIPPTPAGSLQPQKNDFEDPITNNTVSLTTMRLKRNLGKLRLFTLGYTKGDGPKILPFRPKIIELSSLAPKYMSESFSNQLQATSEEQGDSMDYMNRQTSLPDWSMTL